MKNNNLNKKQKLTIIWGLFISVSIIGFLIILLSTLQQETQKQQEEVKPQEPQTQEQPTLTPPTNPQQEQETYNNILNKIEKEVDKLKGKPEVNKLTKKLIENYYQSDGKTLDYIIYNNKEGEKVQAIHYKPDGTIKYIIDYDPQTGNKTKITLYNSDGTIEMEKTF